MSGDSGRGPLDLLSRFAAVAALLWLLAGVAAAAFHVGFPRTAWHDSGIPLEARLGLLGSELQRLAYVTLPLAVPIFLLVRGGAGNGRGRAAARVARFVTAVALLWAVSIAYAGSWLAFRSTGHFLGVTTLRLWWANRLQMLQHGLHMEPWTVVLSVLGTLAFAVAVTALLARRRWPRRASTRRLLWTFAASLFVASSVLAARAATMIPGGLFQASYGQTTGPLNHLVTEFGFRLDASGDPAFRGVEPVVERRPLLSMEEYLRGAGRAGSGSDGAAGAGERAPDVLVVVIESLRPDQLRTFGGERNVMPTVDSLAASGRRFLRHYTQASHSDYADPALFSSHYPLRSPIYHIYPEDPPYPRVLVYDVLDALGYRVGVFSSQNESWSGMKHYLHTASVDTFLHSETYDGPTYVPERDIGFATWARGGRKSGKIDDRYTVAEAIRWIGRDDRPFFIYLNLQSSHVPYVVPADFDPPFGSGRVSFPIRFGHFPRDSVDAVLDLYASSLAYVDSRLARLIEFLAAEGRLDRTILVITGDTGQAFYEHGFTSHASAVYDEVMRVPLVIRAPGLEPRADSALSEHVDVAPTILELLGLPPHPSFQGTSLLAAERRGALDEAVFLVGQALVKQYAIVQDRWKLIYDARTRSYELYDLHRDPGELRNLAGLRPEALRRLAVRLHGWQKAHFDYYADPAAYSRWYPPRLVDVRVRPRGAESANGRGGRPAAGGSDP